jgi:uncharacterized membrane protein YccC
MPSLARATAIVRSLHWRRGLRAGFAVATAMIVCRLLGRPMGWAALGGFEAVLVDNGGPYRSRMNTMAAVILGGAVCGAIGILVPTPLVIGMLVTAVVCFAVTYARVAAQPIASTAVILIVLYFAGFGSTDRTVSAAAANVLAYILGGLWAAVISLFLWPVDPFRPARIEVARCYELLAQFTSRLHITAASENHSSHDDDHTHAVDFKRQLRSTLESARTALTVTAARAPVRTVRARNLSVLLETADMLFAVTIRIAELAELMPSDPDGAPTSVRDIAKWLSGSETAISDALRSKPADNAASFTPQGSHRVEFVARRATQLASHPRTSDQLSSYLFDAQLEALQNIDIAFEALRAVWTGAETRAAVLARTAETYDVRPPNSPSPSWPDALRHNWTLDSVMMRHAMRTAVVGAVDVLLIHQFHISHGFWLAMTSIIVLQPYSSGTVRKGLQRVAGTVGGGFLAALLAATIHSYTGIGIVITACAILTLATYAIDYGWYSFFLTPTFVLLSLPYLRDWRYASVRIVTTLLGAFAAVIAMRVLWPQSLRVELAQLLARSASANAAYVRALLRFWTTSSADRMTSERTILAPARRACGLTSQDAEEALDRVMLEPGIPTLGPSQRHALETENALAFTTYIRRFTQCLTTLTSIGTPANTTIARLDNLSQRLTNVCAILDHKSGCTEIPHIDLHLELPATPLDPSSLAEQMLQRMERQTHVLERAASAIAANDAMNLAHPPSSLVPST